MKRLLLCIVLGSCAPPGDDAGTDAAPSCDKPQRVALLPNELREASGIAISRRYPGILWVHNDSGDPILFGLDTLGNLRARVRITNLANDDWEDIASGFCEGRPCLYVGAIGDNLQNRNDRAIHQLPEPALTDSTAMIEKTLPYRLPKPEDTEALFVIGDAPFVITKGRSGPITLFGFPSGPADGVPELVPLQQLTSGLVQLPDMVTAAAATPDGRHVVIRTYSALQLYSFSNKQLAPLLATTGHDLQALDEFQGEGADITTAGVVYLVTEKGLSDDPPPLSKVVCTLSAR